MSIEDTLMKQEIDHLKSEAKIQTATIALMEDIIIAAIGEIGGCTDDLPDGVCMAYKLLTRVVKR
jgi:hypothetical protein